MPNNIMDYEDVFGQKKNHPFRSGRFVGEQTLKNCVLLFKNFNSFNVV